MPDAELLVPVRATDPLGLSPALCLSSPASCWEQAGRPFPRAENRTKVTFQLPSVPDQKRTLPQLPGSEIGPPSLPPLSIFELLLMMMKKKKKKLSISLEKLKRSRSRAILFFKTNLGEKPSVYARDHFCHSFPCFQRKPPQGSPVLAGASQRHKEQQG